MSDAPPPPIDKAPAWCGYPPQPDGSVWCYSLILGYVTGETYCRLLCECHMAPPAAPSAHPAAIARSGQSGAPHHG